MNALRHGLCARVAVLLPGEDPREYKAFAKPIIEDLRPKGVVQAMLAGRVAALYWALSRLPKAAEELAARGERKREARWFRDIGGEAALDEVLNAKVKRGERPTLADCTPVGARAVIAAHMKGDFGPRERAPAGIVADALAGGSEDFDGRAFAEVMKLEEPERRLWAALQSTLRSLDRRQKLDGRAGEEDEEDGGGDAPRASRAADPAVQAPATDVGEFNHEPVRETAEPSTVAEPESQPLPAAAEDLVHTSGESPARNEPNSEDVRPAHAAPEVSVEAEDERCNAEVAEQPPGPAFPPVQAPAAFEEHDPAGAERTQLDGPHIDSGAPPA